MKTLFSSKSATNPILVVCTLFSSSLYFFKENVILSAICLIAALLYFYIFEMTKIQRLPMNIGMIGMIITGIITLLVVLAILAVPYILMLCIAYPAITLVVSFIFVTIITVFFLYQNFDWSIKKTIIWAIAVAIIFNEAMFLAAAIQIIK